MKENKKRGRACLVSALRLRCEFLKIHWWKQKHSHRVAIQVVLGVALLLWSGVVGGRFLSKQLRQRYKREKKSSCSVLFDYESTDERDFRQARFPSMEERVQLYMGQWYLPPVTTIPNCEGKVHYKPVNLAGRDQKPRILVRELPWSNVSFSPRAHINHSTVLNRIFIVDPIVVPARMFFLHASTIIDCAKAHSAEDEKMLFYCKDTSQTMLVNLPLEANNSPVLLQFGDASETKAPGILKEFFQQTTNAATPLLWSHPVLPHVKKFRKAWSQSELERLIQPENCPGAQVLGRPGEGIKQIIQPIVWKLNVKRHYAKLNEVACNDRPWSEKKSLAVFRGRMNGFLNKAIQSSSGMNDKGTCLSIDRCRLVYNSRKSRRVDAKLTSVGGRISEMLDGYNLTGPSLSMTQLLGYKALIVVEGNDVSSGLKWSLLSNSIVMMPRPKFTSWAMEELLEPWIHYVPLRDDLADAEEKLWWVLRHEQEAARIVRRATLWILDLVYHPQATVDETMAFKEMLKRYARHFVLDETLQLDK